MLRTFKAQILFFIILSGILCTDSISSDVVIVLKKEVYLENSRFNLGDIAVINGSDIKLISRLSDVFLGEVPHREKSKRNITPAEIVMKLGQVGIDVEDIEIGGASVASVYPKLQIISSDDVSKAVKEFIFENMPWDREDVIVETPRRGSDIAVKYGDISIEIAPRSRNQYIGSVRYTAIISVGGVVQKSVDLSLKISVFKKVLVASRRIKRGEMLNPGNLIMVRRQLSANAKDAIDNPAEAVGMIAARNISVQGVIKQKYLTLPLIVKNREVVKLIFQTGGLNVQTMAVARENGSLGDYVRVQNVDSKKIIYGRVVGVRQVSVCEYGGKI